MISINAARIRRYAALSRQMGLTLSGLDALDEQAARAIDEERDLPLADLTRTILRLADLGPPDIGLRCGTGERLNDLGIIGHAIASSRTLEQALMIWLSRANDYEPLIRFQSSVQGAVWRMGFQPAASLPLRARRFLAEEWISTFFSFLTETTGQDHPDAIIELRYAPATGVHYERWLPVIPRFRAPANRLTLPSALLRAPLRSRDDEMLDLILRHFREAPPEQRDYGSRVKRLLVSGALERPTLGQAADALGVSSRTLVRRLTSEGTSFGQILDEHRRDHALILAREGRLGAKDIARALGFRNHQSLRRAFLKWTGEPLGRWRTGQQPRRQGEPDA
nr:AraC family transcriptional regulator [Sphingomonas sp. CDS-1]